MTNDRLSQLESAIGYRFNDKTLLKRAMTHRSFIPESGHKKQGQDNERLEFLGDAVLDLVISDLLFRRFADSRDEGALTKMRAYLVSEARLMELSRQIDLGDFLLLGKGEEKSGGRERPSILADAFEALIGAIYLDGGFEKVFQFIDNMFRGLLADVEEKGLFFDYKTTLQEFTQKHFQALPRYELVDTSGPDHRMMFEVALLFRGKEIARGKGHSKKEAEQKAARQAIEKLQGEIGGK